METQPKTPKRGPNLLLWAPLGILGLGLFATVILVRPHMRITNRDPSRESRTRAFQLAVAFHEYVLEYGQWPTNTADAVEVDTWLVSTLRGNNSTTNPTNTVFMEISPKLLDFQGKLVDQWKRPFWIRFDHDFDSMIADPFDPTNTVNAAILVWSTGGKHPDVKSW